MAAVQRDQRDRRHHAADAGERSDGDGRRSNNAFTGDCRTPALSYASFLIGQIDKRSFTQYLQQEFGARFRAISPYVQDNWKVNAEADPGSWACATTSSRR